MKSLPTWAYKFLRAICPKDIFEQIEGDIIELYNHDLKKRGERKANLRLIAGTLRFLRPGVFLRRKFSLNVNPLDLLVYQLKFATRTFRKDKLFSTLNILGLALGISVSIILLLILQNDLTYDQHFAKSERIYRLGAKYQIPGTDEYIGSTARELKPILKEHYPEIESMVRVHRVNRRLVRPVNHNEKSFYEQNIVKTDSTYFELFDHEFVAGDKQTCLNEPNSVVITRSTAEKYFDAADPLNKILLIDDKAYTVTGVISDLPANTHFTFDFLTSGLEEIRPTWDFTMKDGEPIPLVFWNPDVYTYLLLPQHYDVEKFYPRFAKIYDRYYKEFGDESGGSFHPVLQPLTKIHFSGFDDDEPKGNLTYLLAFSGVGFMIVILACINYMNLATSKAINRVTEVAMKKIAGCGKTAMVFSFLLESIVLSFISLLVALLLVAFLLDTSAFTQLTGKHLSLDLLHNSTLLVGCLGITLGIGIISGLYPAFYLPRIPAISAMKGKYGNTKSGHRFRTTLVAIQFSISILVITCTLYMRDQIDFLLRKDLGFSKENILVVPMYDDATRKSLQAIKNDLQHSPDIVSITASESSAGMPIGGNVMFGETDTGMQKQGGILALFVGDDYLETLGIPIIKGRDFRPGEGVDEDGIYIANEAAVKLMGWGDDALGKKVTFWGGENPGQVIGVVKDFNAASLHQSVAPMFIVKGHWRTGLLQIRLSGNKIPETIDFVKKQWSKYEASRPFEYFFLDQRFDEQYREDIVQNDLLAALSNVCIFISLLGIIGLAAFSSTQRTKEIGLRKIMGAGIWQILFLLSKGTLLTVFVSSLIASPFCWWVVSIWMTNFAYHHDINYLLYPGVTLSAFLFVLMVILVQTFKTANRNPIDSLRYE